LFISFSISYVDGVSCLNPYTKVLQEAI